MKTKLALLFLLGAGTLLAADPSANSAGSAAGTKKHACCSACCAEEKPEAVAVAAPLTARSIYQLDSVWTNDAGASVSLASLQGRPVVIAMFFAHCEYACPVLVSDMQRLRALLPADVRARARFVLVSFDAERDTPPALQAYRTRTALDAGWTLLHGDATAVQELAMVLGVKYKEDARGQFSHSNLITILNDGGEIAYQHAGLMGDVSDAAKAVTLVARAGTVAVAGGEGAPTASRGPGRSELPN